MAGKGISINFLADVRQFLKGTENVEDALEDVSDSLDGMARDGDDATEKLERSFRDLTKAAKSETGEAGDALKRNMKDGADDASKALEQVADDGFSNAKEVAASFDGSAESIVEGFQGAAAEAFSGFGPAGAVAGLLAAAGLGLALQEITKQNEAAEELKQGLTDAYRQAAEEGRTYLDQAAIDATVLDILFDDAKRNAATEAAAKINVDRDTYIAALAGDADALEYALDQARKTSGDLVDELNSARGGEAWSPAVQAVDLVTRRLEEVERQHKTNQEAAEAYVGIVEENGRKEREQIQRTRDTDRARYEEAARRAGVTLPATVAPIVPEVRTGAAEVQLQRFLQQRTLRINIEGRLANGQRVV